MTDVADSVVVWQVRRRDGGVAYSSWLSLVTEAELVISMHKVGASCERLVF